MRQILSVRAFRHLFLAQIVALIGTGLATVALGLLAFDLTGGNAALVLGGIFAVKMVCYVTIAPFAAALAENLPRRGMLVSLDLIRAAVALSFPFVTEVWQIFGLVVVLQAASAGFTPVFQATIPDILPDERDYTHALSLSRLAYDLESIISPLLAAVLLVLVGFDVLFGGTALGFLASAILIGSVILPRVTPGPPRSIYERTTRGIRNYLATPRLRALLALCFAVSSAGAMILVNTVVLIQGELGLTPSAVAVTMAAFGAGSMMAALLVPRALDTVPDRQVMLPGAGLMGIALVGLAIWVGLFGLNWPVVLVTWFLVGIVYSAVLTPSGRLLRRSSHAHDRPALFAAQFALSHACWLITYPLAGVLFTVAGVHVALVVLGSMAAIGLIMARRQWPTPDPDVLAHSHPDLPSDHPHLNDHDEHAHPFVIDDLHPSWPTHR